MEFYRLIKKYIPGLRILSISTEMYTPGVLLDGAKLRLLGHCREVLTDEPESTWEYTFSEASLVHGITTASRKMRSGVRVLGIFSIKGGFDNDLSVHLDISDVRGAMLNTHQIILQPKLSQLKSSDRRRWKVLNNNLVVLEAFYASAFKATFYRKNKIISKAELEHVAPVDVRADVDYHWDADKELVITRNARVPFGVRGFVL